MSNVTAMQISIDTKEDSHEEIKKVIRMLQNLVGDSQEIFTNEPSVPQETASPIANIFGDTAQQSTIIPETTTQETTEQTQAEETSQSTEDLFAELFSEEELKKMDTKSKEEEEDEEEEIKPTKGKKPSIELY